MISTQVSKVILAGGESRRMGEDVDKTVLHYQGTPFFNHVLNALNESDVEGPTFISRPQQTETTEKALPPFPIPIIPDTKFTNCGPLAGIFAGLHHTAEHQLGDLVLFLPVDAIGIAPETITALYVSILSQDVDIVALQQDGVVNPVTCICRISVLDSVQEALFSKKFSVYRWMNSKNMSTITVPMSEVLSVNTLQELAYLEALPCRTLS